MAEVILGAWVLGSSTLKDLLNTYKNSLGDGDFGVTCVIGFLEI